MTKSLKKPSTKTALDVVLVTADPRAASNGREACEGYPGARVRVLGSGKELVAGVKQGKGFLLLDARLPDWNAYELCRRYKGTSGFRVFVLLRAEDRFGAGIARFCGADGTLTLPLDPEELHGVLAAKFPDIKVDELLRKAERSAPAPSFPESLLRDVAGEQDRDLIDAIVDPETKLFNYAFLTYKLDEEFKRAVRFKYPLSCVMLGFDGEASADVLLDLAGIFLTHSRDTDVLGRFDLNSFLFLLPNTGVEGAKVMAERVCQAALKKKLKDLVGEPVELSVGVSVCPHAAIAEREDLFEASRGAFEKARRKGGGVEIADGKS